MRTQLAAPHPPQNREIGTELYAALEGYLKNGDIKVNITFEFYPLRAELVTAAEPN